MPESKKPLQQQQIGEQIKSVEKKIVFFVGVINDNPAAIWIKHSKHNKLESNVSD